MQKTMNFTADSLQRWCRNTGLVKTLCIADAVLVLPDGKMVAQSYAGYPNSVVTPKVVRYLFQQSYGAEEMPEGTRPEILCDLAGIAVIDQKEHTVRVPAPCPAPVRFICELLLANGYTRA